MPNDIAQSAGLKKRAVETFLKILETAELIENPWGKPPRRLLDYVPPSWLELVKVEAPKKKKEKVEEVE